jgi:hypothetical protein
MVTALIPRRQFIAALGAFLALPHLVKAEEYIDLEWSDLVPADAAPLPQALQGVVQHDQASLASQQAPSNGVRDDWNGKIVRLPGFIVPIEYSGVGVSAFILVPFVGACVHVPPPPANQLVFVTTQKPYESKGLFEPVNVIGMFGTSASVTQLAEIGYALSADRIEPFEG